MDHTGWHSSSGCWIHSEEDMEFNSPPFMCSVSKLYITITKTASAVSFTSKHYWTPNYPATLFPSL